MTPSRHCSSGGRGEGTMKPDTTYKHSLTPGLIVILTKFGEAVARNGRNKVHLQWDMKGDLELTKSEYNNAQKLRYFGLIAHYKNDMGMREAGYWLLTRNGAKFLKNQLPIPRTVSTLNNTVVERDIALVFISNIWAEYKLHGEKFQSLWLGEAVERTEEAKQLTMAMNL